MPGHAGCVEHVDEVFQVVERPIARAEDQVDVHGAYLRTPEPCVRLVGHREHPDHTSKSPGLDDVASKRPARQGGRRRSGVDGLMAV